MITYTRIQIERLLKIEFIRFCIVGGSGFVINLALFSLLHKVFGVEVFIAEFISAEVSLFSNFMLHHNWTYKSHKVVKSKKNLLIQFHATSWPAIIGLTLMVGASEKLLHLDSIVSLALSSVIVLAWNFVWSKFIIWKDVSVKEVEEVIK